MNIIEKFRKILYRDEEKQKLLLELSDAELRMDIYHNGELSSRQLHLQKSLQGDGADAYVAELVRILRSELLWTLNDAAELVIFLKEDWCYVDQLQLPHLDKRELHRTLEWEIEQAVPWPRNNYYYDYVLLDSLDNSYLLGAAPQMLIDKLLMLEAELSISIIAITTAVSIDGYLTGKGHLNLLPLKNKKHLKFPQEKRLAETIIVAGLVLAIGSAGLAWGWRWWNEQNVLKLQHEISDMSIWEERINWVESTERRIKHIRHIMEQLQKNRQCFLPQLELWSKSIGHNCWLEKIELGKSSEELVLIGKGTDSTAVTSFVEKLTSCGYYKRVELVEVKNGNDHSGQHLCFAVRLLYKGV